VISDTAMADALYNCFNTIMGTNFDRSRRLDLLGLGVPTDELMALENFFTEEEIWSVIKEMPNDKAAGPNGLTGLFYKKSWEIIKIGIVNTFNAFWSHDSRSFNHLDAYMILLKKKEQLAEIRDYRPISLIHSFSKLVTKCLAKWLASVLDSLVIRNQSAFIKGR
jgi:hypothetical protein